MSPALRRIRCGAHAEDLLARAQRPSPPAPPGRAADEGLSERELEVLRLLATELSGPDIARALFVSPNTLRTHTKAHLHQARREPPPRCGPAGRRTRPAVVANHQA